MLQIISGKFFSSNDLEINHGKGVLFSNVSWVSKIETVVGDLEPIITQDRVATYVFNYVNRIERDGFLVRVGDSEILEQFKIICSFGFNAYFSRTREHVLSICNQNKSAESNGVLPAEILPQIVKFNRTLTLAETEFLTKFVDEIIGLERNSYQKIISSIRTVQDSIEVLNYNFEMAYSLLVYCLESLAGNIGNTRTTWNDIDEKIRHQLGVVFKDISLSNIHEIKRILIESQHPKAQQSFITFIEDNIDESFFTSGTINVQNPIPFSQLKQSLLNTYNIRSRFVHGLDSVPMQLKMIQMSKIDSLIVFGQPYLTFSGLFRLVRHVIMNVVHKLPKVKHEKYNWRSNLPGIMNAELSPELWVWQHENFTEEQAVLRLNAFMVQLQIGKINDLTNLMNKILEIYSTSKKKHKQFLYYFFILYNLSVVKEQRIPNWEKFYNKHFVEHFKELSIFSMLLECFGLGCNNVSIYYKIKCYINYSSKKYKQNRSSIVLPSGFESLILCNIANSARDMWTSSEYCWCLNTAISELPSYPKIQGYIYGRMINYDKLDLNYISSNFKSKK
ncbi:MAG: hypothetical protein EKK54_05575 [Neisseriaceae bacterium]|nr:MAG: hypothetical protein EKK54_05575 [Neisseriaceae bacterium]